MDKSQIKSFFPVSADQMCLSQFLVNYKTTVIFLLCKQQHIYCFSLRLCQDNLGLLLSYHLFVCRNKRHLIHGHRGSALQRDFGNILLIERFLACFEVNYHLLMLQMPFIFINMQGLIGDTLWASISNNSIVSIAHLLKHCAFEITGKVEFSLLGTI